MESGWPFDRVHPLKSYPPRMHESSADWQKCRLSNSSHPDKGSHPWFDRSIFRWCRPIGIPAVKPLSSFLTLLPIKLRCPEAGETKEGLIDQLEQIHNLVPSVLNEGIKAGIVELVDSKVGDKQLYPYQAYHLFSRKSFHPVSVLKYLWPCFKVHLHTPAAFELVKQALNTDWDSPAPSTAIPALDVGSPHSQMGISEKPLCRVDSLLPATQSASISLRG